MATINESNPEEDLDLDLELQALGLVDQLLSGPLAMIRERFRTRLERASKEGQLERERRAIQLDLDRLLDQLGITPEHDPWAPFYICYLAYPERWVDRFNLLLEQMGMNQKILAELMNMSPGQFNKKVKQNHGKRFSRIELIEILYHLKLDRDKVVPEFD